MRFESDHYIMEFDKAKNRVFGKIFGFWQQPEDEPDFINHWREILKHVSPGFSILIDASEFMTPPQKVLALISEVQRLSIEAGIHKRAEVVPGSHIGSMAIEFAAERSGIGSITRKFASHEEAEKWLDNPLEP
ncbi:MAG: hypothetical protein QNJ97_05670 [Myxococcota bacterium]|nr:hypothetical protein [Myxococcota bacterium]